ncbi:MAG TPA: histidine kinase [Solirubrobacteraceae bacterium]|nr:histidine kinase [Solirubrobacteraceae bacterium]
MAALASTLRRPKRSDLLTAGAITLIAQIETWSTQSYEPRPAYAAAALAMTIPLAWRRVAPLAILGLAYVPLLAMAAAGYALDATYIMLVLLVTFATVGACSEPRRAIAGLLLGLALLGVVLAVEIAILEGADEPSGIGDFVFLAVILAVVWALAVTIRERSLRAGELEQRTGQLEREREEQARAAVAEERARIARELHDVVAHSISVIAVQTGSVRRRLRHERPAEAAELTAVEQTARQALGEMRRMLGLLRTDDDGLALAPQPGIDELQRLVDQVREAGLQVELGVHGRRRALPPGIDLAAYRIVQEALTNVLKHAGPASATVGVMFGERELELRITDDGHGTGAAGDADGAGHGLVGMRERVSIYGGALEAGSENGSGFTVRARLPIPAS